MKQRQSITLRLNRPEARRLQDAINGFLTEEERHEGEAHALALQNGLRKVLNSIAPLTGADPVKRANCKKTEVPPEEPMYLVAGRYYKASEIAPCTCDLLKRWIKTIKGCSCSPKITANLSRFEKKRRFSKKWKWGCRKCRGRTYIETPEAYVLETDLDGQYLASDVDGHFETCPLFRDKLRP